MRKAVTTDNAPRPIGPTPRRSSRATSSSSRARGRGPRTGSYDWGRRLGDPPHLGEHEGHPRGGGLSLDKVVKCNVYLSDINDFAAMNEVYATYFTAPYPARTTIQAGALPGGITVEIECIAR